MSNGQWAMGNEQAVHCSLLIAHCYFGSGIAFPFKSKNVMFANPVS